MGEFGLSFEEIERSRLLCLALEFGMSQMLYILV